MGHNRGHQDAYGKLARTIRLTVRPAARPKRSGPLSRPHCIAEVGTGGRSASGTLISLREPTAIGDHFAVLGLRIGWVACHAFGR
jgi:hypothetical protein